VARQGDGGAVRTLEGGLAAVRFITPFVQRLEEAGRGDVDDRHVFQVCRVNGVWVLHQQIGRR
jgi:hypothetical protein